jgi:Dynamin family
LNGALAADVNPTIAQNLDELSSWRHAMDAQWQRLQRFLAEHELLDETDHEQIVGLQQRLKADRLVLAVVAEVSRGKSELINAIFFGDTGRRVLPATPGRTTMCPVELAWDAESPAQLSLLPIETRQQSASLSEWRHRPQAWTVLPLPKNDPARLAQALAEVTRTRRVSLDAARELGFWNEQRAQDNPPQDADGQVEVPAWRHALVNYAHPLLQRGLVLLDTPGLNAIGAEPELTLSLLPSAHATLFIVAADSGVTRSDQNIWRDHLSSAARERFVVLNKIDTLEDALLSREQVAAQVEKQCRASALALQVPVERVFPVSARQALTARIAGDTRGLQASRLPRLEEALPTQLLPRQRQALVQRTVSLLEAVHGHATARLNNQRRQNAEQLLELNSLRGKSGAKVKMLLGRLDNEAQDFERCSARLLALRSVHMRQVRECLQALEPEHTQALGQPFFEAVRGHGLHLGARKALAQVAARAHELMDQTRARMQETQRMLTASQQQLNAEFGFSLTQAMPPGLTQADKDIDLIEHQHGHHLAPAQAWRFSGSRYMEQFQRMLLGRLRAVQEAAAQEVEQWARATTVQMDSQLRERRASFVRRREALERIQAASGELEVRIQELQAQDQRLTDRGQALEAGLEAVADLAARVPAEATQQASNLGANFGVTQLMESRRSSLA